MFLKEKVRQYILIFLWIIIKDLSLAPRVVTAPWPTLQHQPFWFQTIKWAAAEMLVLKKSWTFAFSLSCSLCFGLPLLQGEGENRTGQQAFHNMKPPSSPSFSSFLNKIWSSSASTLHVWMKCTEIHSPFQTLLPIFTSPEVLSPSKPSS